MLILQILYDDTAGENSLALEAWKASWFYDNYCNNADITDNPEEANSDVELNEIND